jgi:hypothetical protein
LGVATGKIAFGEATVINGIQQIGFANTILAANTDDPVCELERRLPVILELQKRYVVDTEQELFLVCKIRQSYEL